MTPACHVWHWRAGTDNQQINLNFKTCPEQSRGIKKLIENWKLKIN